MRGKASHSVCSCRASGITPAYAGKSLRSRTTPLLAWDHPRLCGEKPGRALTVSTMLGSPPPMRGKGCFFVISLVCSGITPAYAGKSANVTLTGSSGWDHPRLCGEKALTDSGWTIPTGSPPPMRGKAVRCQRCTYDKRITPAYAGKSGR